MVSYERTIIIGAFSRISANRVAARREKYVRCTAAGSATDGRAGVPGRDILCQRTTAREKSTTLLTRDSCTEYT
jgi:hypothetical protein